MVVNKEAFDALSKSNQDLAAYMTSVSKAQAAKLDRRFTSMKADLLQSAEFKTAVAEIVSTFQPRAQTNVAQKSAPRSATARIEAQTSRHNIAVPKNYDRRTLTELKVAIGQGKEKYVVLVPALTQSGPTYDQILVIPDINDHTFIREANFFMNGVEFMKFVFQTKQAADGFKQAIANAKVPTVPDVPGGNVALIPIMDPDSIMVQTVKFMLKVKILGLPFMVKTDEVEQKLATFSPHLADAKVIRIYQTPNGRKKSTNILVALSGIEAFNELLAVKRISCFLHTCPVVEDIPITQCSRCLRYGHSAGRSCPHSIRCRRCGATHRTQNCRSNQVSCINCIRTANETNKVVDSGHVSTYHLCPARLTYINEEKKRIITSADFTN